MSAANQDFLAHAKQIVLGQQAAFAAAPNLGVHFGGMEAEAPRVETVEAVAGRLEHAAYEAAERAKTPRGRFLIALRALEAKGHREADTCRGIFNRSLADVRLAVDVEAVTRTIRILNGVDHPAARLAITALCDLVTGPLAMAAE